MGSFDPFEQQLDAFMQQQDVNGDTIQSTETSSQWNDWRDRLADEMWNAWKAKRSLVKVTSPYKVKFINCHVF